VPALSYVPGLQALAHTWLWAALPRDTSHHPAGLCSLLAQSPWSFRRRRTSAGSSAALLANAESGDSKKLELICRVLWQRWASLLDSAPVGIRLLSPGQWVQLHFEQRKGCGRVERMLLAPELAQEWARRISFWNVGASFRGNGSERRGWLISRFLLGLGSSCLLAAAQESVFTTTALCKERSVEN